MVTQSGHYVADHDADADDDEDQGQATGDV